MTATVHHVVGPPGCGKTTWLSRQCKRAVETYGDRGALVLSLTNAAANEAAGRDTGLDPRMVSTMHSACYRAIGMPKVAEESKSLKAFNEEHPGMALSSEDSWEWGDGPPSGRGDGDKLLFRMNLLRHQMVPRERWPDLVREFAELWDDFKAQTGMIDFTDMIERALSDVPLPPGSPSTLWVDEGQDFSKLEIAVLLRWARHVDHLTLVYDPAQALYGWRGADQGMATAEPSIVLSQSYRVPRSVHARALQIIANSSSYREAAYSPTDEEGEVVASPWRLDDPESFVDELDDPTEGTTMVLASCGFMLERLIVEMRKRGIAYANPFSPTRWNPLAARGSSVVTAVDRLLAFRDVSDNPYPAARSIITLAESVYVKHLRSGWRGVVHDLEKDDVAHDTMRAREQVFSDEALAALGAGETAWYVDALKADHRRAAEYPLAVVARWGVDHLLRVRAADRPIPGCVVVGTIHSVKGGEADRVVVFPDLSRAGADALDARPTWIGRDAVWRMFYVAATRARRRLLLGEPGRASRACPL